MQLKFSFSFHFLSVVNAFVTHPFVDAVKIYRCFLLDVFAAVHAAWETFTPCFLLTVSLLELIVVVRDPAEHVTTRPFGG
jgi:hypothetical protein